MGLTTHLLKDICDIEQRATTEGAAGGSTSTWAVAESGVICNVQENSASPFDQYDEDGDQQRFTVFFDKDKGISSNMRLHVTKWHGVDADFYIDIEGDVGEGQPGVFVHYYIEGRHIPQKNHHQNPAT